MRAAGNVSGNTVRGWTVESRECQQEVTEDSHDDVLMTLFFITINLPLAGN